jgi:hypothetical protein
MKKTVSILLLVLLIILNAYCQDNKPSDKLKKVFEQAVKIYPDDSLDLYNRDIKDLPSNNLDEIQKKIDRLEALVSESTIEKYQNVKQNLKPIMSSIITAHPVSKSQAQLFATLYSDYDHFSGESLLDNFITNEENYNLVWESMKLIVREASKDTSFIACLILLKNNIRTNVELAEKMPEFVIEAISNNPKGFLDMYLIRNREERKHFSNHVTYFDSPDKQLIKIFKEIGACSIKTYSDAVNELIEFVDK